MIVYMNHIRAQVLQCFIVFLIHDTILLFVLIERIIKFVDIGDIVLSDLLLLVNLHAFELSLSLLQNLLIIQYFVRYLLYILAHILHLLNLFDLSISKSVNVLIVCLEILLVQVLTLRQDIRSSHLIVLLWSPTNHHLLVRITKLLVLILCHVLRGALLHGKAICEGVHCLFHPRLLLLREALQRLQALQQALALQELL